MMAVNGMTPVQMLAGPAASAGAGGVSASGAAGSGANRAAGPGFAQMLADVFNQANDLSHQADTLASVYAAGGPVSLDQLMIAEQEASLALDLVVQLRNRVVGAYQTFMNMQV